MKRKEDPRLITGRGNYVDDMVLPGMLYMALVRADVAHAKVRSIDKSAAEAREGIYAVLTGEDIDVGAPLPMVWVPPGVEVKTPEHWPLARGEVNHVGDPVAVIVGADKYGVVDALADVIVEYDELPAVIDPE
jgi:carbon-monoxide dehydrogenase large subunit